MICCNLEYQGLHTFLYLEPSKWGLLEKQLTRGTAGNLKKAESGLAETSEIGGAD